MCNIVIKQIVLYHYNIATPDPDSNYFTQSIPGCQQCRIRIPMNEILISVCRKLYQDPDIPGSTN